VAYLENRFWTDQESTGSLFETALSCLWRIKDCHAPVSHPASLPRLPGAFQTWGRLLCRCDPGECRDNRTGNPIGLLLLFTHTRRRLQQRIGRAIYHGAGFSGGLLSSQLEPVAGLRFYGRISAEVRPRKETQKLIFVAFSYLGYTAASPPARFFRRLGPNKTKAVHGSDQVLPALNWRGPFLWSSIGRFRLTLLQPPEIKQVQSTSMLPVYRSPAHSVRRLVRFSVERKRFRSCCGQWSTNAQNCAPSKAPSQAYPHSASRELLSPQLLLGPIQITPHPRKGW